MNDPLQFVYWLQGFIEIENPKIINEHQLQVIKDHIALVLTKVMPDRPKWSGLEDSIKDHPLMKDIMFCSNGVAAIEFDGREPKICQSEEKKELINFDPFTSSVSPRPAAGILSTKDKYGQPPASC